jgi:purine-nucleoside phosphorylase
MEDLKRQLERASSFIQEQTGITPRIGIILGTGMGDLLNWLESPASIPYSSIPWFPHAIEEGAESAKGAGSAGSAGNALSAGSAGMEKEKLVLGKLARKPVIVLPKRFHYYEGYTARQIAFPIRLMRELGVRTLIVCNTAGGLNPLFSIGDLMVIVDHINLIGTSPLIGPNPDWLGIRFPDMKDAYDPQLVRLAGQIALEEKIHLQKGVYVAVHGPNLETPAETRFLRSTGADAVGMSTVPEVIVGIHAGLRILGFSIISNLNLADAFQAIDYEEIVRVAAKTESTLRYLIEKIVARMEIPPAGLPNNREPNDREPKGAATLSSTPLQGE